MNLGHVVIGGGSGFIGSAIACGIRRRGGDVTIISRNHPESHITWDDIATRGLPKDTTHVINVAGQNILDLSHRWTDEFKNSIWKSRVETTKSLARAVSHSNAKSFITISGVAYYKPNDKEYTEDDKCEKYDYLSELTHAWESAAKLPDNKNCRQVTIRSGVVLGRTGGMIHQLIIPYYFGFGGPMGSGNQILPWIHISDLVDLFIYSLIQENINGVLNGVAPQIITNKQFASAFGKAMMRPSFLRLPPLLVDFFFGKERAKIILEGQKVLPKRVLDYGFIYRYPKIQEACEQFAELVYFEPY